MRQKKRKTTERETRYKHRHDSLDCPKDTLVKPNKLQTGLSQPLKVSLSYKIVKYKPRAFNRKIETKPILILLNISLTANNHF